MNPTPTTDTQRLRELLAAATQGEHKILGGIVYVSGIPENLAIFEHEGDGILHIALRNAVPALLDELDSLRTKAAKLTAALDAIFDGAENPEVMSINLDMATRLAEANAERDSLRRENEELKSKLR